MDMSDPASLAGVSEHSQQTALLSAVAQLAQVNPQLKWLFAIPNGGDRNMAVAANMKAEGVRAGVADLLLPVASNGYHGFFVEMKRRDGGTQSDKQLEFERFVVAEGYLYAVFHNWIEALKALLWYLNMSIDKLQQFSWIGALGPD